jgi:ABC-type transport system substrate-binding protein
MNRGRQRRTRPGVSGGHSAMTAVIALSLLLVLSGCDTTPPPRPSLPDAQQILRVELPWEYLYTLDPASEPTHLGAFPLALFYSGLVALDEHNTPRLADAASLRVSDDGLTYTFTLRAGLRFSDSTPITAADAAYSLDRAIGPCHDPTDSTQPGADAPRSDPPLSQLFASIKDAAAYSAEGCGQDGRPVAAAYGQRGPVIESLIGDSLQPIDATTLGITLAHPDAGLLVALAHPVASVVERAVIARYGDAWTSHLADNGGQGTSGMYAVKSWQQVFDMEAGAGQKLVLTRQAHHSGTAPRLREVDIVYFRDEGHAVLGYERGSVDLVLRTQPLDARMFQSQPGRHQTPSPEVFTLALNPYYPPLDDPRLRQALALALDRTLLGLANVSPAAELLPATIPGVAAQSASAGGASGSNAGNAAHARELWLGYVHDRCGGAAEKCAAVPLVERTCSVESMPASVAQAIGGVWQAALPGLRIRYIDDTPNCFFAGEVDGCFRPGVMAHTLAADVPDAQALLAPFAEAQESAPYCVLDPLVRDWLRQAAVSSDPAARARLQEQAQRQVLDSAVVLSVYRPELVWLARPRVANLPAPAWYWFSPDAWVAIHLVRR